MGRDIEVIFDFWTFKIENNSFFKIWIRRNGRRQSCARGWRLEASSVAESMQSSFRHQWRSSSKSLHFGIDYSMDNRLIDDVLSYYTVWAISNARRANARIYSNNRGSQNPLEWWCKTTVSSYIREHLYFSLICRVRGFFKVEGHFWVPWKIEKLSSATLNSFGHKFGSKLNVLRCCAMFSGRDGSFCWHDTTIFNIWSLARKVSKS